ncbi:MAG: Levodione reductase [Phycisphaerae bacterium]|nr:Levodione reductase [Phycisphaerae bacterium]
MQLKNRVALITGGGSGIGEASARLMAAEGAKVAVMGRRADTLQRVADAIRAAGGEALAVPGDVSVSADVEAAVARTVQAFGRLDIVFANAGVNGMRCPIEELAEAEWDQTLDINLKGTFLTIKYAVPHLKAAGGGAIVICSSINGTRCFGMTGATAYSASKAGQVAMTKMLAVELGRSRIRVNAVCPGSVNTDLDRNTWNRNRDSIRIPHEFPRGRMPLGDGKVPAGAASGEQVARLVLFLVSDAADHITGTEIWLDGGESIAV